MIRHAALAAAMLFATASAADAADRTQTFLWGQNFPQTAPLPVRTDALPGNGLTLTAGATNAFSLLMGTETPGANLTTGQSIRDTFFMSYLAGDLFSAVGAPMDTGQSGQAPFYAVARHYNVGDPNDLHVMMPHSMQLRAICSNNHTNCSQGNVYGAMVRVPYEIRPGMTIKVRYRSPTGPYSWCPIWLFSGSQISPGPGGNPWNGFGSPSSLVQEAVSNHSFEIDANDNYPRWNDNPSVPVGQQVDFLTPDIYGVQWNTPPHQIYGANQAGFAFYPDAGPALNVTPQNLSSGFHDLVLSWDGAANTIYEFIDGKLIVASYMEYAQAPTYTDANGNTKVQAMHIIIGNQAIPAWLQGANATVENDGKPFGWSIFVQEISAWNGLIANPTSHKPN